MKNIKKQFITAFVRVLMQKIILQGMDILIGARMHATIGAFSAGVAVIPFAYSRKFQGLFNSLEYQYIIDAKSITTETAVENTLEWIKEEKILKDNMKMGKQLIEKKIQIFKDELSNLMDCLNLNEFKKKEGKIIYGRLYKGILRWLWFMFIC